MFNKEEFKIKLEFIIRHYHAFGYNIKPLVGMYETEKALNIYWQKAKEILYQNPNSLHTMYDIPDADFFNCFSRIMDIGLSELNKKIANIHYQNPTPTVGYVRMVCLIKIAADNMAKDIQKLYNIKNKSNEIKVQQAV
ncbi:MAG: hypothetical protein LC134_01920 [Chitinophagales bacterium]|nr:hypothetical protein [Chitinophagales bacterium]